MYHPRDQEARTLRCIILHYNQYEMSRLEGPAMHAPQAKTYRIGSSSKPSFPKMGGAPFSAIRKHDLKSVIGRERNVGRFPWKRSAREKMAPLGSAAKSRPTRLSDAEEWRQRLKADADAHEMSDDGFDDWSPSSGNKHDEAQMKRKPNPIYDSGHLIAQEYKSRETINSEDEAALARAIRASKAVEMSEDLDTYAGSHATKTPHACQFPGCTRSYNRSDELIRHERTNGHSARQRILNVPPAPDEPWPLSKADIYEASLVEDHGPGMFWENSRTAQDASRPGGPSATIDRGEIHNNNSKPDKSNAICKSRLHVAYTISQDETGGEEKHIRGLLCALKDRPRTLELKKNRHGQDKRGRAAVPSQHNKSEQPSKLSLNRDVPEALQFSPPHHITPDFLEQETQNRERRERDTIQSILGEMPQNGTRQSKLDRSGNTFSTHKMSRKRTKTGCLSKY